MSTKTQIQKQVLLLEAFYGGSHKQLCNFLEQILSENAIKYDLISMTDKKWHWRSRTSALYFADNIPKNTKYRTLFVSATTNVAELVGLCPQLQSCYKIVYYHENQLVYPVRKQQDRDFQYGYNQIVTCLAADYVLFNSCYNMESFLKNINVHWKVMPDYRPKDVELKLRAKCQVLYFPLEVRHGGMLPPDYAGDDQSLHIVWPHRWEHDKNPESFFRVVSQLHNEGYQFNLSLLGQTYADIPQIFDDAKTSLESHIKYWGYQETKEQYIAVLKQADVVVSTANHEFFGVSMLEAVMNGCYPLCPNRLVYPEIFEAEYLYNTDQQLYRQLRNFCRRPDIVRRHKVRIDLDRFDASKLSRDYLNILLWNDTSQPIEE